MILHDLTAWPGHFSFELSYRFPRGRENPMIFSDTEPSEGRLRIGFELPDGTRLTARLFGENWPEDDWATAAIVEEGGQGGDGEFSMRYTARFSPPPGEFSFVWRWPRYGHGLAGIAIPSGPILDAMERATRAWPEG